MFIIEALDNADAEKNAAKVLKKLQAKAAPAVKKGKPPGLSKKAMANVSEDPSDAEEDEEESGDDEVVELRSRPKASHGRSFSGESCLTV